jgi:predicted protein tyrosine phosphatase
MATTDILSSVRTNVYLSDGTLRYRPANEGTTPRWLFVDDNGVIKSATAQLLAAKAGINARSCGVSVQAALIPVSLQLANWAQNIVFLDQASYDKFQEVFKDYEYDLLSANAKSIVIDLTEQYFYMQPQLVIALKEALPELAISNE